MKKILSLVVLIVFAVTSCGGGGEEKPGTAKPLKLPEVKNLSISAPPEGNKLSLTWQMPDDSNVTGVVIVRKKESQPGSIEDGTKVFEGEATSFEDTGLTNGVEYFYRVFTTDGKGNYSDGVVVSGTPADTLPPPEVSDLQVEALPQGNVLKLTWQNPDDAEFQGVVVVRKEGSAPASRDDGVEVYRGDGEEYTDTGLTNGTTYFYAVYTYDDDENYSSGVTVEGVPQDTLPPPQVSNLVVTVLPQGGALQLFWQNPDDAEFQGVVIVRKAGSAPTSVSDGTEVFRGLAEEYTDEGLTNGVLYFYAVFSYDDDGNYSDGVVSAGTPQDLAPPPVTDFSATHDPAGHIINLAWQNPDVVDFNHVKILRRTAVAPDSCGDTDATEIYSGNATSYTDTGLNDGVLYCYGICAVDDGGNYSDMVTVCETPQDELPPENVYNVEVTVVAEGNALKFSWDEPADGEYVGVVVLRGTGYCPQTTADTYSEVVTIGTFPRGSAYFEDTGLENDVEYCYSFFSYDDEGNYSDPYQQRATPHDSVPPEAPVFAKSVPSIFGNIVAWGMSTTDDVRGYRILRKTGGYPTGATDEDAEVIFEGIPEKDGDVYIYTDRDAPMDEISYYAIYAYDESPNYSESAEAKSGMILDVAKGMGISGFYNEIVPYGSGFALFYTDYKAREGVSVKYNHDDLNFSSTNYKAVVSAPVSDFKVVPDGNGGYYVVVAKLWEKPGIHIYDFDESGNVSYVTEVTSVIPSLEEARFVMYWTFASIRDNDGNIRVYYFEKVTDNPTLTEAVYSPASQTITYTRDITSAPDDFLPFAVKGVAGKNDSIAHLAIHYIKFDSNQAIILKADETQSGWKFTTVESSLTNGGHFVGIPAINVKSDDGVLVYYKRNEGASWFRGILKEYYGEDVTVQTFGLDFERGGIYFNEAGILLNEDDSYEILAYHYNPFDIVPELTGVYIDSDSGEPVTATIDRLSSGTSLSLDYPFIGRLRTSGFISGSGKLLVSGWMLDLKGYVGSPFSTDPFDSAVVDDNPDTHWELIPVQPTAFVFINDGENDYIAGTGFDLGEVYSKAYLNNVGGAVDVIDSNVSLFDTFYTDGTFYSVGRSGDDLVIWVGDPDSGFTPHTIASGVRPINAAVNVYKFEVGVAYTTSSGAYFCLSQDSGVNFTCTASFTSTPESRWIDVALDTVNSWHWFVTYVDDNGLHLVELNDTTVISDTIVNVNGTTPVFSVTSNELELLYYNQADRLFFIDPVAPDSDETVLLPCENLPDFSGVRAPTLIFTPGAGGNYERSILYQGSGNVLLLGVEITEDVDTPCWYFNVPISFFADDGGYILRERLGYGVGQDYLRIGYPAGILMRNTGSAFVQDILFTR